MSNDMETKGGFLLARGWNQAEILVFLFGFFVLGFLAHRIYTGEPPIPGKVVDPNGRLLFTHFLIRNGRILKKQNRLQMSQVFPFPC
jgi:nitric oxide reductase subunit B